MVPIAVVAALLARRRTGEGTVIDVAQVDLAAYMLGTIFLDVLVNEREAQPVGNESAHFAPHGCYPCAGDDRWCVIAVEDDAAVGGAPRREPASHADERFDTFAGRLHHRPELDELIAAWTSRHDPFDVMNRLQEAGVAGGCRAERRRPGRRPAVRRARVHSDDDHPVLGDMPMAGLPLQFTEGGHEPYASPPPLGADNEYVITEMLGHSREELARWEREEVVY